MTRRTRQLRAWMTLQGIKADIVAQAAGVSKTAVYRYIKGDMPSSNLRAWFLKHGCPPTYLPAQAKKSTSSIGRAA